MQYHLSSRLCCGRSNQVLGSSFFDSHFPSPTLSGSSFHSAKKGKQPRLSIELSFSSDKSVHVVDKVSPAREKGEISSGQRKACDWVSCLLKTIFSIAIFFRISQKSANRKLSLSVGRKIADGYQNKHSPFSMSFLAYYLTFPIMLCRQDIHNG